MWRLTMGRRPSHGDILNGKGPEITKECVRILGQSKKKNSKL